MKAEVKLRESLRHARALNKGPIAQALFDQIDRQLADLITARLAQATGFLVGTTKDGARITVERREQRDGTVFWAVSDGLDVLGESGNWERESRPSERSEAFIARTRFTLEKAFKLAESALKGEAE